MSDNLKHWLDFVTHQLINQRAHEIWIEEGEPEGKANQHWLQAEIEIEAELMKVERQVIKKLSKKR